MPRTFMDAAAKPHDSVNKALNELISIGQSIGKIEARVKRTKPGSKLNTRLWYAREKLLDEATVLRADAQFALSYLKEDTKGRRIGTPLNKGR